MVIHIEQYVFFLVRKVRFYFCYYIQNSMILIIEVKEKPDFPDIIAK